MQQSAEIHTHCTANRTMKLDFALLNAIVAVANAGGFREAARVTGTNPSRLSDAVRRAEQQLGVLAGNDDMAIGVAKACYEAGLRLPQDVSLAGFDDSVIGKYYNPSLTTIHVPMEEMIRNAIEMVLMPEAAAICAHRGELVCRESVIAPKTTAR